MIENLVSNLSFYLESSVALAFFAAYLGGILISFTPCTYPLIPVTVGFIGIQGSSSRGRGFLLSLFYVVGMAATYAVLGAAAALSGRIFGQMQTNFWTYFIMANVCLVMGLSMLDVFNISIPVPQKLMKLTGGNGKKGFLNSFLIGAVSGVVAIPPVHRQPERVAARLEIAPGRDRVGGVARRQRGRKDRRVKMGLVRRRERGRAAKKTRREGRRVARGQIIAVSAAVFAEQRRVVETVVRL